LRNENPRNMHKLRKISSKYIRGIKTINNKNKTNKSKHNSKHNNILL